MAFVDFTTQSLGTRPPSFALGGFNFTAANMRVRVDPGSAPNGLTFSVTDLRIELEESAADVFLALTVDNATQVMAYDMSGAPIPPVYTFPENSGGRIAVFHAPNPVIRELRVTVGDDENLINVVTSHP